MARKLLTILALLSATVLTLASDCESDAATPAPPPSCTPALPGPPSNAFCLKPPVVPDLSLPAYANGTWYQTHVSGSAALFGSRQCTTANYTLGADGNVAVLNCNLPLNGSTPECARAVASPRENATETAELSVLFPSVPRTPFNPGRYSIAALLGTPEEGYRAAAVYQCAKFSPEAPGQPGYFIIARSAEDPEETLEEIKEQLRCRGYYVDDVVFMPDRQMDCKYFFEDTGFEISMPGDGFGGPPPGVDMSSGAGPPPGVDVGSGAGPPPGV